MGESKGPWEQFLDLAVYAPLGLLMNLDEVVPQLIEKGHQQVHAARFFGRMAVETGEKEARRRVDRAVGSPSRPPRPKPAASTPAAPTARPAPARAASAPAAPTPVRKLELAPDLSELAIPDYDVLAASQVVPRLAGLAKGELEAVRRYEAANRGRKTILSKIAQLQA